MVLCKKGEFFFFGVFFQKRCSFVIKWMVVKEKFEQTITKKYYLTKFYHA